MSIFRGGSTERCTVDLAGVNKTTAAYYLYRLREIISYQIKQEFYEVFGGEVDARYFGGYRKVNRGRGAGGRVAVPSLLKRCGEVCTKIIQGCVREGCVQGNINADHLA